jgi:unsaturated rhamnogalacturonyl hydrolase
MQYRALSQSADAASIPWSLRMAASALNRYSLAEGRWHYKDGLLFKAIYHLWQQTGDSRYWQSLAAYVDRYVDASGAIATYSLEEYNLDQINPGKLLFPLYRATGQECYRQAIWLLREQLRGQPRTHVGGFWHKQIYPFQMWLDGIYMASPFYAEFASTFAEPAAFDDVALQIIAIEKHTRDPRTGLLYHAWDESRQQRWADPISGCSAHFWSRAIGWYLMALVDVLDHFPQEYPARQELLAILERTLSAVARVQDEATGLWWQVLDQGSRPGNYLEASGTGMVVYAIAKGVRRGYLDKSWLPTAVRGFAGLLKHRVTVDNEGQVHLHGVCSTAGLGGDPYRDGSFEYYVSEPIITNDLHGVGPFILAAVELESAAEV